MAFTQNIWNQLKNLSKGDFISALERDGWVWEKRSGSSGSIRLFIKFDPQGKPLKRIEIHFHHSSDTMRPSLLKGLLTDTGWATTDMRRLKLIK